MKFPALLCIFVGSTVLLNAQSSASGYIPMEDAYKRVYNVVKVNDVSIDVDGRLDDDLWQVHGHWSEDFVQASPIERGPSDFRTVMKILYDDRFIYVGIIAYDPQPQLINRFVGNRDDSNLGDEVSVAFDTYHDFRSASEFVLNAGGNHTDVTITDQMNFNDSWNAVWEGKTYINEEEGYWSAEYRIPFNQLRYNHDSPTGTWGLSVTRTILRANEKQNWSLIPQNRNGFVYSFGEMHGMTELPRSRGIEFSPYLSGEYQTEPKIDGSPYQKGDRFLGNAGLDAKFAISDYTLDITINPDYGQVEQDPSVMNLSTTETFYDEKRPFFLEGEHIFNYGIGRSDQMFYSRRIGATPSYHPDVDNQTSFTETQKNIPIIGALKLTGTSRGGLTLGVIQSFTPRMWSKVTEDGDERREVVEPFTSFSVVRAQKNWSGNTLLGAMVTSTNRTLDKPHLEDILVKDAFTAGVDFTQYFKDRLYYIDTKVMVSSIHGSAEAILDRQLNSVHFFQRESSQDYLEVDPTRTSLTGTGGYLEFGRKGNSKWVFTEMISWYSPEFDMNDVGYMRQADEIGNETNVEFNHYEPWWIFRSNEVVFSQENSWNFGGDLTSNAFQLIWNGETKNRFEMSLMQEFIVNELDSRMLRGGPDMRLEPYSSTSFDVSTDQGKRLYFTAEYSGDHSFNNDRSENSIEGGFSYRIGNHVLLSGDLNYEWNRNNLQYVTTLNRDTNPSYVMARMNQRTYGITFRAQVNVTPDISFQFYGAPFTSVGKYNDFKAAADTKSRNYNDRFRPLTTAEAADMSTRNADFTFNEFRSNLVARWEYMPGSTLYLVWEHSMSDREGIYVPGWGKNLDRMFGIPSTNTFMIKINYWFGM